MKLVGQPGAGIDSWNVYKRCECSYVSAIHKKSHIYPSVNNIKNSQPVPVRLGNWWVSLGLDSTLQCVQEV